MPDKGSDDSMEIRFLQGGYDNPTISFAPPSLSYPMGFPLLPRPVSSLVPIRVMFTAPFYLSEIQEMNVIRWMSSHTE